MIGLSQVDEDDLIWPRIPGPPPLPRIKPARTRNAVVADVASPKTEKSAAPSSAGAQAEKLADEIGWASRLIGACALAGLACAAVGWFLV